MKTHKPCKGTSKALGYGCGAIVETKTRKYGICRECFLKWLKTPAGVEYALSFARTIQKTNKKKKLQEWNKRKAILKDELKTLSDWIKEVQKVFNKYIRLRDEGKPCISCGRALKNNVNASHYYNANNHWSVRFHEDNVHSSCINCNQHLHGNLIGYREGLIDRIGIERVNNLSSIAKQTRKYTISELKELREYYKKKIKTL
jgi:hypothetical protein